MAPDLRELYCLMGEKGNEEGTGSWEAMLDHVRKELGL